MATPKQTDPQFKLRMTPEIKEAIEKAASINGRSMNAEILFRLEQSFDEHAEDRAFFQGAVYAHRYDDGSPPVANDQSEIAERLERMERMLEMITKARDRWAADTEEEDKPKVSTNVVRSGRRQIQLEESSAPASDPKGPIKQPLF